MNHIILLHLCVSRSESWSCSYALGFINEAMPACWLLTVEAEIVSVFSPVEGVKLL